MMRCCSSAFGGGPRPEDGNNAIDAVELGQSTDSSDAPKSYRYATAPVCHSATGPLEPRAEPSLERRMTAGGQKVRNNAGTAVREKGDGMAPGPGGDCRGWRPRLDPPRTIQWSPQRWCPGQEDHEQHGTGQTTTTGSLKDSAVLSP